MPHMDLGYCMHVHHHYMPVTNILSVKYPLVVIMSTAIRKVLIIWHF